MKVVVIGPFPPPLHGSSKNLLSITKEIESEVEVSRFSISPLDLKRNLKYHIVKGLKVIKSALNLLFFDGKKAYITVDAGFGMFYTLIFVFIMKCKSMDAVIHHRSFAYIDSKNFMMSFLKKISKNFCHVFLCECMSDKFQGQYGLLNDILIVSNAKQVIPVNDFVSSSKNDFLVLGYLSNLTVEKGFIEIVSVFLKLIENNIKVKLIIAGPASDSVSKDLLDDLLYKHPDLVDYLGPVYGEDKNVFFSKVDVFLFPTNYSNEAQPNVLFEAMAFGNVIVSTEKGCIPSDINVEVGRVFEVDAFVNKTFDYIKSLEADRNLLNETKCQSLTRIKLLKNRANEGHDKLISRLTNYA